MSHIVKLELQINDLESLKKACERLKIQLVKEQKTFKWYGSTPAPCDAAIKIPNANYEIGVVKKDKTWELQCDWFDSRIERTIGKNGGLLKQAYVLEKSKLEALRKGFAVKENRLENGTMELRIQVQ